MMHERRIGAARIVNLVEYVGPTHDPRATFPAYDGAAMAAMAAELPPYHYFANVDRLVIAIQVWLVFCGGRIVLIDAGVGNFKSRPAARMNALNTLLPSWLEAAGAGRHSVTDVVMTHLHGDHVGWNTTLEDGRWVPTFPNARYHVPRRDFDYFKRLDDDGVPNDGSFGDSVMPIVQAGLAQFIGEDQREVAGCLDVAHAYGHTPGQLNYWLRDDGAAAVFSADIFHHPVQILNPGWNTAFCIEPDRARATRAAFLAKAAETGALIMPCHFPAPHCGRVRRQGRGFAYEPAR